MNDYKVARKRMVREQLKDAGVTEQPVLAAMREVPRHIFVPKLLHHRAYMPCALPIGYGQTISQPFTVALMTALLTLQGGEQVLEIGTGSGYQAAVLSRLASRVISVERIKPLARRAAAVLSDLQYDNVEVHAVDGSGGYPNKAPYDAIVVTACAAELPEDLLHQLKDGGLLLLPMGDKDEQTLYRYQRQGGEVVIERSVSCRFVPLKDGILEGSQEHA